MSEPADSRATDGDWYGLRQVERTLPSEQYFDPAHYERELQKIWYRHWLYLCRSDELPEPLSYRTFEIGTQPVLLLRDEAGALRAFFNTCRHRGSVLCQDPAGRLRTKSITCPYHSWTYDLRGQLLRVPLHGRAQPVNVKDFPLYRLGLEERNGFVFVNLGSGAAPPFEAAFDPGIDRLAHWPLADLAVGHTLTTTLRCNWKVFWENFNECLHCPNVHPALSNLVPIYRRALMDEREDPQWRQHADSDDPQYKGGLRSGAATWSTNGRSTGHEFPDLTADERRMGYHFVTMLPSLYLVGHVDYVRAVRLRPLGPELTELQAQWLYPRAALADPAFDLRNTVEFPAQVIAEDGAACELAQRGMRALRHASGVLMPEEYEVHRFHNWVRDQLARS
jgi:Rieske 2Fe-2S family protein